MTRFTICVTGMVEMYIRPILSYMAIRTLPGPMTRRRDMAAGAIVESSVVEADAGPAGSVMAGGALIQIMISFRRLVARFTVQDRCTVIETD